MQALVTGIACGGRHVQELVDVDALVVHQAKEWGEILSGFETKNRYTISDRDGHVLFHAAEVGGNPLVRFFLKAARPFEIAVVDAGGGRRLGVERPFRLLFQEATVRAADGRRLGRITWRFSILRRRYAVEDESGTERFSILGPLLRPWTFLIREGDREVGRITKRWSGLGKEMFTDADRFALEVPRDWRPEQKALMLGIVFFIDFRHFENRD